MNIIRSLVMVFSMYTRIPMPKVRWEEKNMRYMMPLFPLVGAAEGLIFFFIWKYMISFGVSEYIRAAVMTVFPLLYTGGIHMDGFLDTSDALGSHRDKEKKLEILKDPHLGSAALLNALIYMLLYYSAAISLKRENQVLIFAALFILSRAYSGISVLYIQNARGSGSLMHFQKAGEKTFSGIVLALTVVLSSLAITAYLPLQGGIVSALAFFCFFYNKFIICAGFGGITGDIAGFFLQMTELLGILALALIG